MAKKYVLDTNVLMHDHECLTKFEEHDLYLPIEVVEELDNLKTVPGETGYNARQAIKALERVVVTGSPREGIALGENLGKLRFLSTALHTDYSVDDTVQDDAIYNMLARAATEYSASQVAKTKVDSLILRRVAQLNTDENQVVLVSNDAALRLRCDITLNLLAEQYKFGRSKLDLRNYFAQGTGSLETNSDLIDRIYTDKKARLPDELNSQISHNGYMVLKSGKKSILVKSRGDYLHKVTDFSVSRGLEGIIPRNKEQNYLMDAVVDTDIETVAAVGMAGTGKTLIALAAALHQVLATGQGYGDKFEQIIVYRPTVEVGEGLGFLPGDVDEKIGPHFAPIKQALKRILGDEASYVWQGKVPKIDFRPVNFARGDTIDDCIVIVDEAQNLPPQNIKTIGTRMGERSKIILTGDPFQVDHKHLDDRNNGLSVMVDSFMRKRDPHFAAVILTEGERSRISTAFAKNM